MRNRFDAQLAELHTELIQMGALCEEVITLAVTALTQGDIDAAARIAPLDKEIDRKERDIETLCMRLLLQQQPVAGDLRQISAALKMITDMERIGDQAEDIAEIVSTLQGRTPIQDSHIREMAAAATKMVTQSVEAYVRNDHSLAKKVIDDDDIIDQYFEDAKKAIIQIIAQNPQDGEYILEQLMISKYIERIGDHATNIAGWVLYSITGKHKELDQ